MHGQKPAGTTAVAYHERDPPPYPGNNFQGLRESFSGSEASTDFSLSSTESLSARQEPQGQETASLVSTPIDSLDGENPFAEHLIPPLSACFENLKNSSALYNMGGGGLSTPQSTEADSSAPRTSRGSSPCGKGSRTPPPYHQHMAMKNEAASGQYQNLQVPGVSPNISPQNSFKGSPVAVVSGQQNISLEQLKQLHSEQAQLQLRSLGSVRSTKSASPTPQQMDPTKPLRQLQRPSTAPTQRPAPMPLPPPNHELQGRAMRQNSLPEENRQVRSMRRSFEMLDRLPQTHSHPDLSRLRQDTTSFTANQQALLNPQQHQQSMQLLQQQQQQQLMLMQRQQSQSKHQLPELDHAAIATRATQMVERLSQENLALRKELHTYYKKVCKLQKFDGEIDKVHRAYESLVKHSQKRENLEKAMRMKLESTIQTLNISNQQLREQLDKAVQHINNGEDFEPDAKREIQRKDSMLNKIMAQSRDILLAKERLQLEVANQRSSLNEQRTKIALLDNALTQAQSNAALKEEQSEDETVASLQKAFCLLQTVSTQSGGFDQQLCAKLQEEIHVVKSQQQQQENGQNRSCDADEGISSDSESPTSVPNLMQLLQEREQRIMVLESQVQSMEQRVLEESTLRQLAVDMASMPKDARLAALEQSSITTDKLMDDARVEKLRHLDEVYQANRRLAEAEAQVSSLEAHLAKKDAIIKVLKRQPSALFSSPFHSPHQSLLSPTLSSLSSLSHSPIPSTPYSVFSNPGSVLCSRQNSQIDSHSLPALNTNTASSQTAHSKSNSDGSAGALTTSNNEGQWKEMQQKLSAQAALFGTLQSGSEQLKKCFWQV